jgi:hypothetical protein
VSTSRPDPWDRRPDDSQASWQAFVVYRDMGLTRSNAKVARALGKSKALIDRWSRTHNWVIRAAAFDSHEDRMHLLEMRKARVDAEKRNLQIAGAAMNVAAGGLREYVNDTKKVASLKPADIARLMEVASRLEALTLGNPTENVKHSGTTGQVTVDVSNLTDEDRHARMLMLRRELDERLLQHDNEAALMEDADG